MFDIDDADVGVDATFFSTEYFLEETIEGMGTRDGLLAWEIRLQKTLEWVNAVAPILRKYDPEDQTILEMDEEDWIFRNLPERARDELLKADLISVRHAKCC